MVETNIFIPTTKYIFEDHISKYYKISLLIFYFYKNKTPFPKTMFTQENDHCTVYEQTDLTGCMRAVEPVTNTTVS